VFNDVYSTIYIDRNGLLCNNIFELTGNPYTIDFITELAPTYRLDFLYDENNLLYGFTKDCKDT